VRLIYVDEAGTSANEPVPVVVGIIVEADMQWRAAQQAMMRLLSKVPTQFQQNFVFHATDIWNSPKYRPDWNREARLEFLKEVLAIPRTLGLSIGFSACRKELGKAVPNAPIDYTTQAHLVCFMDCMDAIDLFLKDYAWPNEVAAVVAEDVPEIRKWLRGVVEELKTGRVRQFGSFVDYRSPDQGPRKWPMSGFSRITRFVDVTHFVAKDEAPLLQIADACAFALRRFFAGKSTGEEFVMAMLGAKDLVDPLRTFDHPCLSGVVPFIPMWLARPDTLPPELRGGGFNIRYSVDF
jgi:hypothetical protein